MGSTTVARTIAAPIKRVFDAVADIANFQAAIPAIVQVDFLSEVRRGVGTRFRETRRMGKRLATAELEVTEYIPQQRVRLLSDAGGTIWDTVFTVQATGGGATELTMVMEARPYKLAARLFTPLIKGMIRKHIERDMDAVKAYCER